MNRQERRRFAKTNAGNVTELLAQGFRRHQQGQLEAAENHYRQVLQQDPRQPDAMRLLGELLLDRGLATDAVSILKRLVSLHPQYAPGHYSLGNAYRLTSQLDAAIAGYQATLTFDPGLAEAHHGLGLVLRAAARETEAVESFRLAVEAKPALAEAWKDLGLSLAVLGELREAEAALRRAVLLQPALAEAQRHLAAIRSEPLSSKERTVLLGEVADPRTTTDTKIDLLFTLGRLDDKAGRFDAAFRHFSAANALLRVQQQQAGQNFDRDRLSRDIDKIIATFRPDTFATHAAGGNETLAPVFIVGMARTGSTLFEQIAASHSQVFGAGEYAGIGSAASRIGWGPSPHWSPERLRTEADNYLRGLTEPGENALRSIDKMPDNIFQLGLIAALFPNARIIFCARDPRDTILSCFFQRFAQPLTYDTDLHDCAFRLREVERLTGFWRDVLPLRHMTMSYESLLEDPEGQSRALIDFLGLEWEPQCLEFHKNRRAVRTASWAQVRQPLYHDSVGRWRHYEMHLKNLQI